MTFGVIVRGVGCFDDVDWLENANFATAINSCGDAPLRAREMADCIELACRFDRSVHTRMDLSQVSFLAANDLD